MAYGTDGSDRSALRSLTASLRAVELPDWLTAVLDPDVVGRHLRGRVGEVVPGAVDLVGIRLQDVRARRSWWLRFEADVLTGAGVRQVVLVAERPVPGATAAAEHGSVTLPGLGLRVVAVDGDPALPALAVLSEPVAAGRLLESALRDGGRPGLRVVEVRTRLARYKPGHRATFVHDLRYPVDADPSWPRRVVAKTYRDDDGAATDVWMRALWGSDLGGAGRPRLAEPLGYLPEHHTLLQRALPGDRTLADLLTQPRGTPEHGSCDAALGAAADGLVALHASGVLSGPRRTVAGELETVQRVLRRVGATLPAVREAGSALVNSLAESAAEEPRTRVPVHGAFRPAQVLLDGATPGFLDFDGFGSGEPALDVGRFLARVAELVTDPARRVEHAQHFLARYRAGARLPADRVARCVCLDLAGGAVRSWYRARPQRAALLLDRLDEALEAEW